MAEIDVQTSSWKLVEVGRVVIFATGPYAGRLAAISEIIDHKRVCLHFASSDCGREAISENVRTNK